MNNIDVDKIIKMLENMPPEQLKANLAKAQEILNKKQGKN